MPVIFFSELMLAKYESIVYNQLRDNHRIFPSDDCHRKLICIVVFYRLSPSGVGDSHLTFYDCLYMIKPQILQAALILLMYSYIPLSVSRKAIIRLTLHCPNLTIEL